MKEETGNLSKGKGTHEEACETQVKEKACEVQVGEKACETQVKTCEVQAKEKACESKERKKTSMNIRAIFENCKKKLKGAFKKCKETIKETYRNRKKAYISGFASILTVVLLVSIFSMQFQINKTDILSTTSAQQLASSSKYVIYNVNDEELPVVDSEGNEIGTRELIDGKQYYIVETDESGDINKELSEGIYKVVKVNQADETYQLEDETSFIQVSENNEVSEIEVQEFNITNTYVGPEISSKKSYTTEYNNKFVVEGEKITYTITVENSGHMPKQVVVKDTIPDGTTLEQGTIKVDPKQDNAGEEEKVYTEDNLREGIVVTVPAIKPKDEIQSESASNKNSDSGLEVAELDADEPKEVTEVNEQEGNTTTGEEADGSVEDESEGIKGKVTITFVVKVNNLDKGKYSKKIENTAMVDDEPTATIEVMVNKEVPVQLDEIEVTNTYIGPIIDEDKTFTTQEGEAYVKENEKITYKITVENSGLVAKNVKIKDVIPVGTTFESESILIDDAKTYKVDKKVTDEKGTHIEQEDRNTKDLTQTDLTTNGIEVTVPKGTQADDGTITNGKVTLSFVVTVDEFGEEANGKPDYSKTIVNMAEVDNVPTRKVVVVATKNEDGTTKQVTITKKDSKDKKGLAGAQFTLEPKKTDITKQMQTVQVKPALQVTKKITSTPKNNETYTAGERIKCEVTVKNTGNVALKDVNIKDKILENIDNTTSTLIAKYEDENQFTLSEDLLAGESKKITYEYVVTEEDITNETLTNKTNENVESITVTAKAITPGNDEVTANNTTPSVAQSVDTYTFELAEEKYVSKNNVENSKAIAYIPIDLTTQDSYTGKNTLIVNAQINGGISDYGYAMVIEQNSIPEDYEYNDLDKAFIAINGEKGAQDYKVTLEGTKKYTLILIYAKDEIANEGSSDAFTINSVKVVQNEGGKEETITLGETGEEGTTSTTIPYGIYTLTETKAPEHYKQLEGSVTIEIGEQNKIVQDANDEKVKVTLEADNFVVENKTSRVIVHHYLRGTEDTEKPVSVSPDEELKGVAGKDTYETKGKDELEKYERETDKNGEPKKPEDKNKQQVEESGTFEEEDKEVFYYYVWKKANIQSELTKTSDIEKITQKDQPITYKIQYKTTIEQYEGNATITIVDHLPYQLDLDNMQEKEDLADGKYDANAKTITWEITEKDINTYSGGKDSPKKVITITKNIRVIFKDIDANATKVENTVDATLHLETTDQTEKTDPAKKEIPAEFNKDVTVTKTWEYGNEKNIYAKPSGVKLQLYDEKHMETPINEPVELRAGEDGTWTYTFKNLKRFNQDNEEIIYTVKELPLDNESLDYYAPEIQSTANTITIVNRYKGPEISKEKSVEIYNKGQKVEESTRKYALVEDTLKYTITVTNAGGVEKEVIIKDSAPEGSTFVDGSMKINENGKYQVEGADVSTKTEDDLKEGIKVTVPAKEEENGKITLSFEVNIIDDLTKDTGFTKHIKNKATVIDEGAENKPEGYTEETEETDTIVNKSNIEFSKTSTQEQDSKIAANEEIEYIIEVKNTGTAPEEVKIQDREPKDTTYVDKSFSIEEGDVATIALPPYTMDNLKSGITLTLEPNKKVTIKFKVKVNAVNTYHNADKITNKATVNNQETEEVTHKYVEPIIKQSKTATVQRSEGYVLEKELITYTITVTNEGEKEKEVAIKDQIPKEVTPKEETLTITAGDNNILESHKIQELQSEEGLKVTVPAAEDKDTSGAIDETEYGKVVLTFQAGVNALPEGIFEETIRNTAKVDEKDTEETETPVKKSNVTISKVVVQSEEKTEVKAEDTITYKIILDNELGTVEDTVKVQDILPTGVSTDGQDLTIREVGSETPVEGTYLLSNLTGSGIDIKVPAGKQIAITYTVKVTGSELSNDQEITNTAKIVDTDKQSEVKHTYVEPLISSAKDAEIISTNPDHDDGYALEGDTIKYTITLTNKGGAEGKVKVKDIMPSQVQYTGNTQIEVKENGQKAEGKEYTIEQLVSDDGIEVTVPAATKSESGRTASTVTLTFEVKVSENIALGENGYKITVKNTANVDENEPSEAETEVRKEHITVQKTASPQTGTNVKKDDVIKYTITITNDGTAAKTVTVKDKIPTGTKYKENSVEVDGDTKYVKNGEYKTDGDEGPRIETKVTVPAATGEGPEDKKPGQVTVSFEVTVENLDNEQEITNKATVDEQETTTVKHTYIEPVIKSKKKAEIIGKNGLPIEDRNYALEGEKIRYTITVTNTGDLKGNVTIKDTIPNETTFVDHSIKVDGQTTYHVDERQETTTEKTSSNLESGIEVTVPARTSGEDGVKKEGQVELSFEVTINKTTGAPYTRKIENTATVKHDKVDGEDETPKSDDVTVNKPHVTIEKKSDTANSEVAVGNEITYVITATNDGFAPQEVLIKDIIPAGTTFKEDSGVTVEGASNYVSGSEYKTEGEEGKRIEVRAIVPAAKVEEEDSLIKGVVTVQFTVTVTGKKQAESEEVELENGEKIQNIATIVKNPDGESQETETTQPAVEHTFVKPIISAEKQAKLNSEQEYAIEGDTIEYTITLKNDGDYEGEVTVKDTIPEGTELVGNITIEPKQDEEHESGYTKEELQGGIKVKVAARESEEDVGKTEIKFTVQVKPLSKEDSHTKTIVNTAYVGDDDEGTPSETITVNESEIGLSKTAKITDEELESTDIDAQKVKIGSKITYTITVNNTGTAVEKVKVTDQIPEGTTFDNESIKVNQQEEKAKTQEDLTKNGIEVTVEPSGSATIEFTVTVTGEKAGEELDSKVKLNDGDKIVNKAKGTYGSDKSTDSNKVESTYIEPIISSAKKASIKNTELGYVKEGEEITYEITVQNKGSYKGEVIVEDTIPQGTEFVQGSVEVTGDENYSKGNEYIEDEQKVQVTVTVPAASSKEAPGEVKVKFRVKVQDIEEEALTRTINNTAKVTHKGKPENVKSDPVIQNKAKLSIEKKIKTASEEKKDGGKVALNGEITYVIYVKNSGPAKEEVKIKDFIPKGTKLVAGSIKIDDQDTYKEQTLSNKDENDLGRGLEVTVPAKHDEIDGQVKVEFKVRVDGNKTSEGKLQDREIIQNQASVENEKEETQVSNTVQNTYVEPIISGAKKAELVSATEEPIKGREYALEGDRIKYTITVMNKGGIEKVVKIEDTIPSGTKLVEGSLKVEGDSNFSGGKDYNEQTPKIDVSVTVPAATTDKAFGEDVTDDEAGKVTLTFEVTVKELVDVYEEKITNQAIVDGQETQTTTTEVKKPNISVNKTSNTKEKVTIGDEIVYTITVVNEGTAPEEVLVKDAIPAGTKLVSVKIGEDPQDGVTAESLAKGLKVTVPAATTQDEKVNGQVLVEVTVQVTGTKDLEGTKIKDREKIENIAKVNENPAEPDETENEKSSEKVERTYVEPIIESTKTLKVYDKDGVEEITTEERGETLYALEGEIIEYTITVTNKGGLAKDVTIKDSLPAHTHFVDNSVKVNGNGETQVKVGQQSMQAQNVKQNQLGNGVIVNVPSAITDKPSDQDVTEDEAGKVTLSFRVKIDSMEEGTYKQTITNTANVDTKETTQADVEVRKPHVTIEKTSNTVKQKVAKDDEIEYTITLTNDGYAPAEVLVKDVIPEGTEYKANTLKVNKEDKNDQISSLQGEGLTVTVPAAEDTNQDSQINEDEKKKVTIEFTVTVTGQKQADGELENNTPIRNTATLYKDPQDKDTPEKQETTKPVEHTYVKPIITSKKVAKILDADEQPVQDRTYALAGDKIEYTITITNSGDYKGTVNVKDDMPEGVEYTGQDSVTVTTKGQVEVKQYNIDNLKQGFEVEVPAKTDSENGQVTVTFKVTVKELTDHSTHKTTINNVATVGEKTPSSETIVNEAALAISKTSKVTDDGLEDADKEAKNVKVGSIITYTITVTNDGTAPETVKIEDTIPEGTEFVANSIKINNDGDYKVDNGEVSVSTKTEDELKSGISVEVPAKVDANKGKLVLTFEVKVTGKKKDGSRLANGDKIENTGYIENTGGTRDDSTTENTYIEPIISSAKKAEIFVEEEQPAQRDYALRGDTIKYTITVKNTGAYKGKVTIKDSIPEGTTFVADSIKVTGAPDALESYGETDLTENGITVTVPAANDKNHNTEIDDTEAGIVVLTFKVTVDKMQGEETTKKINNIATVTHKKVQDDPEEPEIKQEPNAEVTVKRPEIKVEKFATASTETNNVTVGDSITYRIVFTNSGDAEGKVKVKDVIPDHTELEAQTIKINDSGTYLGKDLNINGEQTLNDGIEITVPAKTERGNGEVTLEFVVDVQDTDDQTTIENFATVNKDTTDPESQDKQTNKVTNKYVEPVIEREKTATIENVKDRTYAMEGDRIKYTITVTNKGGLEKLVTIKDDAPKGTKFVQDSIEVEGATDIRDDYTLEELKGEGINVTVPAAEDIDEDGQIGEEEEKKVTLSFIVEVEKLQDGKYTTIIENTATVDGTQTPKVETTVNKANIEVEKTSETAKKVKVDDKITYKITVTNKGEAVGEVTLKDKAPEGTEYESLTVEPNTPDYTYEKLSSEGGLKVTIPAAQDTNGNKTIEENEYTKVTLTLVVKVTGKGTGEIELNDGYTIKNVAKYTVDGKETDTDEVTHEYVKPVISSAKVSNVAEDDKVESGDEITYTITVTNKGGLETTVKVADKAPDGTKFKPNSIKVNGQLTEDGEEQLTAGINVPVKAQVEDTPGTGTLEFTVTVNSMNELENGATISNVATVDGDETEEVQDTYAKPIITSEKIAQVVVGEDIQERRDYVAEGETIRYTITIKNSGDAEGTVKVKDRMPQEVQYSADVKIKVNGEEDSNYTVQQLVSDEGIQVKVPAKTDDGDGKVTLSFDVTVGTGFANEANGYTTTITNNATITHNGEEQTAKAETTLKKEHITSTKKGTIQNADDRNYALEGDVIEYTITIENDGTLEKDVKVIDKDVKGAQIIDKIKVEPDQNGVSEFNPQDLTTGITVTVPAKTESNGKVTITFKAKVDNLTEQTYTGTVSNTAQVDDTPVPSTGVTVNKPNITATKTSTVENGINTLKANEVTNGTKLKYTITVNNINGTAPKTVKVKDTIPHEVQFVSGSIVVDNQREESKEEQDLINGIDLTLNPGETKTIEFEVTVQDCEDDTNIVNKATVDEAEVQAENKYVEPKISATKVGKVQGAEDRGYALEKDIIEYTITIKNEGLLAKDVKVTDSNIAGALAEGKVTVAPLPPEGPQEGYDVTDLTSEGITVRVPAATKSEEGVVTPAEVTLTFNARVNAIPEGYEAQVTNTANVDEKDVTSTPVDVKKPHIVASKSSDKQEKTVKAGDTITYTITLDNQGTAPGTALVKDEKITQTQGISYTREATVTVTGVEGLDNKTIGDLIGEGISVEVPAGKQVTLSFTVSVTGDSLNNKAEITNVASVNGQNTPEVTDTFVKPIIEVTKKAEIRDKVQDRDYAVEGDTIIYTIVIANKGGAEGTVKIKEEMPAEVSYEESGKVTVKDVTDGETGEEKEQYTIQNLLEGQNVTVEAGKTLELSFEVTVEPFGDTEQGTTKKVVNKVVVNDKEDEPKQAEITVNTADIAGSKKAEIMDGAEGLEENQVTKGTKIKYTITVTNNGDADGKAVVKDIVPEGTKLVPDSVQVDGDPSHSISQEYSEETKQIEETVTVKVGGNVKVSFEVIVEDLEDGKTIQNSASVNDGSTTSVQHTYVEPVITATKSASPETGSKVVANQEIKYTITVTNTGRAKATATVKDEIPDGTIFKERSIKVKGAEESEKDASSLREGIQVEVPAATDLDGNGIIDDGEEGKATVEFTVKVKPENEMDDLATIENEATVTEPKTDANITTPTVTHTYTEPNITASKTAQVTERKDPKNASGLSNTQVTVGDKIKYTITVTNSGHADGTAVVKDVLPKGVQYSDEFTVVGDKSGALHDINQLTSEEGMTVTVPAKTGEENGKVTISFTVTVVDGQDDNAMSNGDKIVNKATVNGNITTEEVTHTYVEPDMTAKKEAEIVGLDDVKLERNYALEGDTIKYTITVTNKGEANGQVTIKDTIPQGTSFVPESIKVDGALDTKESYDLSDLTSNGIIVTVPKANNADEDPEISEAEETKVTVTFKVTVNPMGEDELTEKIKNTADVNGKEVPSEDVEVDKPQISITKSSDPENKAKVKAGQDITYSIKVANKGTAPEQILIKETIPAGKE